MLVDPVIVVPGITASYLEDRYTLPHDIVWSVLTKDYERAALHPDDTRYEAREPAVVKAGQIFEIAYEELVEELRYNLADKAELPVPVYPFGYDWRQSLETAAAALHAFVEEVIDRTAITRHYAKDGYGERRTVNLVGHSMGGLVILTYLATWKAEARVNRVVTLATPFRGSFEAVPKIATGTANLGPGAPSSREREAARLTPALYSLLPALPAEIDFADGLPETIFDPEVWQPSIIDTIEDYVRRHAVDPSNRKAQARKLFQGLLDAARQGHDTHEAFRLGQAGLEETDWLCVAGVDANTRVALEIRKAGRKPEFVFRSSDMRNRWAWEVTEDRWQTGDGTVPLRGAIPAFLPPERVVCVRPDDFGYWEIADKLALKAGGFHGILPNMDMLHRLIVRFLKDREDRHGNTWGAPLPDVAEENWAPPLNGKLRHRKQRALPL